MLLRWQLSPLKLLLRAPVRRRDYGKDMGVLRIAGQPWVYLRRPEGRQVQVYHSELGSWLSVQWRLAVESLL